MRVRQTTKMMEPTTGLEPVNLFLTKEVLYLLSYVGQPKRKAILCATFWAPLNIASSGPSPLKPALPHNISIDSKVKHKITRDSTIYINGTNISVMERGGFEPPKASPADLQSAPFDRSGTSPDYPLHSLWSWRWDSNPQPADYKSAALPIELRQQIV